MSQSKKMSAPPYCFYPNVNYATWTLYKNGVTYGPITAHFDVGVPWYGYMCYPAYQFKIGDGQGLAFAGADRGTVVINYNGMEACTPGDWQTITSPTCTTPGYRVRYCTKCGAEYDHENIPALGHDWQVKTLSSATCTTNGYQVYQCSRCSSYYSGDIDILGRRANKLNGISFFIWQNALGHDWRWVVDSNLSCTTDYTGHKTCVRSVHDTSKDGAKNQAKVIFTKAPGHHYEELVNDKKATCTTNGRSHYQCTNIINGVRCTATQAPFTVPATGHYITSDVITKTPSVYENGVRKFKCEYCGNYVAEQEIEKRKFNIYLGDKRITTVSLGDNLVWNGSHGEDGTDGSHTGYDWIMSLIENNWYYSKNHY